MDTQPKQKKPRARKNVDFEGEESQYPRVKLPQRTACEIDPEQEKRMADFLDKFGFDVVGPEGPLGVSTLNSYQFQLCFSFSHHVRRGVILQEICALRWPFPRVGYASPELLEKAHLFLNNFGCVQLAKLGSTAGHCSLECVRCGHISDYLSPIKLHLGTCTAFDSTEDPPLSLAARELKKEFEVLHEKRLSDAREKPPS